VRAPQRFGSTARETATSDPESRQEVFMRRAEARAGLGFGQLTGDGLAAELTVKGTKCYRDKKFSN
jgi:hypothetical protein